MEELIGQTLGKYKLYSRLGTGGMARVYKAYQENLDRYVALKVMHNYLTEEDEFVARFKREASAVARLRHPNIVQVHDFDINTDQIHYMVMEFIDGPSLKDELEMRSLRDTPFALIDATKIISGLASAIDYAHERGIVHRDIKPANIMFTADGHVVLTDFGIVRMVGATYQTSTGFLAGTPAYMSPEQGRGEHGDHRSDIYSLGIILFELLTGRLPFDADTPFGLIKQHLDVTPPSPSEYNPDIPLAVEMVLNKALAKQPDARYQKARGMAAELQQATQASPDVLLQPPPVTTIAPPKESEKTTAFDTPILPEADTAVHSNPYRGLFAFSEEDAPFFFGREAFTEQLIAAVETQPLIAVVGPSGSGKSSVVHAGLLPMLRQQPDWTIATMRPGSDPFQSLAATCVAQLEPNISETSQLTRTSELAHTMRTGMVHFHEVVNKILAKRPNNGSSQHRLLLIVDQFEEIYTLCADSRLRRQFLDELLNSVDIQRFGENATFVLVFTLRTDFLSQALNYRPLADALQNMDIKLGPMTRRELGRAIASPARRHGFAFETGLVARILEDVGDEPGNLPLLEFALDTLWDSREDRKLTNEAYEAIGRVEGALARYADSVLAPMSAAEQEQARHVFIQMVRPGAGTEDTRRLATRAELGDANWKLARRLADARLVVTSRDPLGNETVEVVHEALIRGWRRLREWMNEDRAFRSWQERLRAALEQWTVSEYDEGALLRGLPLTEAEGWLSDRQTFLSQNERAFIDAGMAARDAEQLAQEQAAEEQRRMAEQERIERRRAEENARRAEDSARYARRLTRLAAALVVFMVIALIAAFFAVRSGRQAADNAATAVANEQTAIQAQQTAESARAASEANANLLATAQVDAANEADAAQKSAIEANNAQSTAVFSAGELAGALGTSEANAEAAALARQEAEAQSRLALSRELSSAALSQLASDPQLALLLALEAANIPLAAGEDAPAGTQDALYQALLASQLRFALSGHTDQLTGIAFSPDGAIIGTASRDQSAKLWNAATGQELFSLDDHTRAVTSIAFSPDGSLVATGGDEGFVILWDPLTGGRISVLNGGSAVQDMAFSPDGTRLTTVNANQTVRVWNIDARDSLFNLSNHHAVLTAVAYHPDGTRFVSAGKDGQIVIWDAETGATLNALLIKVSNDSDEPDPINGVAYSSDGTMIVTAHDSGTARMWDAESLELIRRLSGHTSALTDVGFSPDGTRISTASADGTVKVWDSETGQALFSLIGHVGGITAVTFNPDGSHIATASQDATARVWNATSVLDTLILSGSRDAIFDISFSDDGTLVATGGRGRSARVWNAETGKLIDSFDDHNAAINAVDLDPTGSILATASDDYNVRLWNLNTREAQFLEHQVPVLDLRFSADGQMIATAGGTVARLWNIAASEVTHRFEHETAVRTLIFHPDGEHLITGDETGLVTVWQIETEEAVLTFAGHSGRINDLAISPDGHFLVTAGNDNTAKEWDLSTGELLRTFAEHSGAVLGVAFNADGSQLATSSADKTVKLWDPNTGQSLRTYLGHTSTVHAVTFSPDGAFLATAGADRTAQLNRLDNVEALFDRGMLLRERGLTDTECAQFLRGRTCVTLAP